MTITSTQNEKIKTLRALYRDKKFRAEKSLFLAEGVNLVKDIPSHIRVRELYLKASKAQELSYLSERLGTEAIAVTDSIFDSIADAVTPSGVIAVVEKPACLYDDTDETALLLDGISDPGNLGTIIRTAAARNIKKIVCLDCTDAYSPKCVRSAMSGTFFTRIFEVGEEEAFRLLDGYDILALDMDGENIFNYERRGKIAIAVGSEAHGIRDSVKTRAARILALPMEGRVESLNAAVSAGIAMYVIR